MYDLDGRMLWDGPLIILINRASASASELVAQSLQDYGRALIVGDDHSYGKGSHQSIYNITGNKGLLRVTKGLYYSVSGKTPQLTGVLSDITVPGPLSMVKMGEAFTSFPLEKDTIPPSFIDGAQPRLHDYDEYIEQLKSNSELRIKNNQGYQELLDKHKENADNDVEDSESSKASLEIFQCEEAYNIMKELISSQQRKKEN